MLSGQRKNQHSTALINSRLPSRGTSAAGPVQAVSPCCYTAVELWMRHAGAYALRRSMCTQRVNRRMPGGAAGRRMQPLPWCRRLSMPWPPAPAAAKSPSRSCRTRSHPRPHPRLQQRCRSAALALPSLCQAVSVCGPAWHCVRDSSAYLCTVQQVHVPLQDQAVASAAGFI